MLERRKANCCTKQRCALGDSRNFLESSFVGSYYKHPFSSANQFSNFYNTHYHKCGCRCLLRHCIFRYSSCYSFLHCHHP